MHYYVVGVNGTGKSTLLTEITRLTGIKVIHGTSALMEYMGVPGDYDAVRAMDQDAVLIEWGKTVDKMLSDNADVPFMLDTHILNLIKGVTHRRDGPWMARFDALIMVKASPEIIMSRIDHDSSRDRALFPDGLSPDRKLAMLDEYQQDYEQLFHELAREYGLPSHIVDTDEGLGVSVPRFMDFHNSLPTG